MPDRNRQKWETLGRVDPYWGVLSHDGKQGGRWEKDAFFRTGEIEIRELFAYSENLGIRLTPGVALDFGCGVGRLTRALAAVFGQVTGVDISESMLSEARQVNAGVGNITFLRNDGDTLKEIDSDSVDLAYSNIALQHAPSVRQQRLIRELCRVVRPGGALVFQTPSHPNFATPKGAAYGLVGNGLLNLAHRVLRGRERPMEVHCVHESRVRRILADSGLALREAQRYDAAGPAFVSLRYFAVKPGQDSRPHASGS